MADDVLTEAEKALIDGLATEIIRRPTEELEGALVASYDYLVKRVDELGENSAFTKRDRMVLLSLFPFAEDGDGSELPVDVSSEVQKAEDVAFEEYPLPLEGRCRQAVDAMPFEFGRFMILYVGEGSTKWYKVTSTGVICFTRP